MSLYLPDQKLGSRSQEGSSSHKFMLKGRQTGSMHRGHSWVFRAETYDTMMAWYDDIKNLTEKTGEERNAFVRRHTRSISAGSNKAMSVSSDGLEEDEADAVPYSANASAVNAAPPLEQPIPQRPSPGGRFPSDIQVNHNLQSPAPASSASSDNEHDLIAAAGITPGGTILRQGYDDPNRGMQDKSREVNPYELSPTMPTGSRDTETADVQPSVTGPVPTQTYKLHSENVSRAASQLTIPSQTQEKPATIQPFLGQQPDGAPPAHPEPVRHNSLYGDWMASTGGVTVAGTIDAGEYRKHQLERQEQKRQQEPRHRPQSLKPAETTDSQNTIPIPPKSPKRSPDQMRQHQQSAVDLDLDTAGGSDGISGTAGGMAVVTGALHDKHRQRSRTDDDDDDDGAELESEASTGDTKTPTSKVDSAVEPVVEGAQDGCATHARKTGRLFPKVLRHNTDVTVSDLHVPGEFPSGQPSQGLDS